MDEGKEGRKPRKEERNENNYKDRVGEKVRQRDMHVQKARARKIGRDREKGRDRVIEKGKETERMGERE